MTAGSVRLGGHAQPHAARARLSGLDAAMWAMEQAAPMHVGAVLVLEPGSDQDGFTPQRVARVLAARAAQVPRLRRRLTGSWTGGLYWDEDPDFNPRTHIHIHTQGQGEGGQVPDGGWETVSVMAADLMRRPLEQDRPPWAMHVIDGLGEDRVAVLVRLHHALCDGAGAIRLGLTLLDPNPASGADRDPGLNAAPARAGGGHHPSPLEQPKHPQPGTVTTPSTVPDTVPGTVLGSALDTVLDRLLSGAVACAVKAASWPAGSIRVLPTVGLLSMVGGLAGAARGLAGQVAGWPDDGAGDSPAARAARGAQGVRGVSGVSGVSGLADVAVSVACQARWPDPRSPLAAPAGPGLSAGRARLVRMIRLAEDEVRAIRRCHGGTDHEVLLAVLTGGLRSWLATRGQPVDQLRVRALIPVNMRPRANTAHTSADHTGGNQVSGYLCELPVDQPDPARRLALIRQAMHTNKAAGPYRGAGAVALLADTLPPAAHRVLTPLAAQYSRVLFDLVVTTLRIPTRGIPAIRIPSEGVRTKLPSIAGAAVGEVYPLAPLAPGHALAVALCHHHDNIHIGLHADADAVPDLDKLTQALPTALTELTGGVAAGECPPRHATERRGG